MDTAAIQPSRFLSLPREIRDLIYLYLFDEGRIAPREPSLARNRAPQRGHPEIYFEAPSPRPVLLQLKLVCHCVYEEVVDVLAHHADKASLSFPVLDIMLRGCMIWPTWAYLPQTSGFPTVLLVNLRLFGNHGWWGSEYSTGGYRALWSFFNMLVFQGPCLFHNRVGLGQPLRFDKICFRVFLCYPTTVDDLFGTCRDVFDELEKLASVANVGQIEVVLGPERRAWQLRRLPTEMIQTVRVA